MEEDHDCGNFDKSYVRIYKKATYGSQWIIYLDGEPEISAEYCPYCGEKLEKDTHHA